MCLIRVSRGAGVASALKIYSSTLLLSFWPYMARRRGNKLPSSSASSISPLDDTYLIGPCQNYFCSLLSGHETFFSPALFVFFFPPVTERRKWKHGVCHTCAHFLYFLAALVRTPPAGACVIQGTPLSFYSRRMEIIYTCSRGQSPHIY